MWHMRDRGTRRAHLLKLPLQIPDPVPQHLVLPREHLRLSLIKRPLVPPAQDVLLAPTSAVADGGGSQPGRGAAAGCAATPAGDVRAGEVEG